MSTEPGSRSSAPHLADAELRLPRAPGLVRRFWQRHPRGADVTLAVICFAIASLPLLVVTVLLAVNVASGEIAPFSDTGYPVGWQVAAALFGALSAVALLWRRRLPLLVFAIALAANFAALMVTSISFVLPTLLVATYTVAAYCSARTAWLTWTASIPVTWVLWWLTGVDETEPIAIRIALVTSGALFSTALPMGIATVIGTSVGSRRRYVDAIIDRSRQLLVERDQQAQLATAAERTRIAREMHDIVSHSLTVIVALADGAVATRDPDRARDASERVASTARAALTEMRDMLGVLRDPDSDAPLAPTQGGSVADSVDRARAAGFPVTLRESGTPLELAPPHRLAINRIVQESLTNAMRHAPSTSRIEVAVAHLDDAVEVTILNDGVPVGEGRRATSGSGFGLQGIQERTAHVGGAFEAGPVGADRWRVTARIPVSPSPAPDLSPHPETSTP